MTSVVRDLSTKLYNKIIPSWIENHSGVLLVYC